MKSLRSKLTFGLLGALVVGAAPLADSKLFVYPAQGQSGQQLADDRYACHTWAVTESGFDPTASVPAPAPTRVVVPVAKNPRSGATAKGAAAGAVLGGVVGANGRDTLEGAVIGAVVGATAGAVVEQSGARQAQDEAQEEAERRAAELADERSESVTRRNDYGRALRACLESRGYTVR